MKVIVLAEGYPSPENFYNLAYIHSRLLYYVRNGIAVKVLSFQAKAPYQFEGVAVVDKHTFSRTDSTSNYDIVISHAPNLRNHFLFVLKNIKQIKRLLFFIHGHEVLIKRDYYPRPFEFDHAGKRKELIHSVYDLIKVRILNLILTQLLKRKPTTLVFVSEWMKIEALRNLGLDSDRFGESLVIINNNINESFYENSYTPAAELWGDFITIRPLDNPKYAVDIVLDIAQANPKKSFHIYGRGQLFRHRALPANVVWHDRFVPQKEMIQILCHFRTALMPTRLDSQGVSVCEFASFGIPTYTSNLPVCKMMVGDFENVRFFSNEAVAEFSKIEVFDGTPSSADKRKFAPENTVLKEIELLERLVRRC